MMGNHGVLVTGATVSEAFDELYYLERACKTLVLAYSSGQKLALMSEGVAEQTARDWDCYPDAHVSHFAEMKKILDREDPSYAE
jgi:ribulose-5-phosphate 4-epimerase/fuculose-1-phosphate aldolase